MSHVGKSNTSCRCLDSRHKNNSPSVAATMKGSIPESAESFVRGFRKESALRYSRAFP